MSAEEKGRWIKTLQESVSVISTDKPKKATQGLSILDRVKDSLKLGKVFDNWKEKNTHTVENGYSIKCLVPSSFKGG